MFLFENVMRNFLFFQKAGGQTATLFYIYYESVVYRLIVNSRFRGGKFTPFFLHLL